MHINNLVISESQARDLLQGDIVSFNVGTDEDTIEISDEGVIEEYSVASIPVKDDPQEYEYLKIGILTTFKVTHEAGVLGIQMIEQEHPVTKEKVNHLFFDHEEYAEIDTDDALFLEKNIQLPDYYLIKSMQRSLEQYSSEN